MTNAIVIDGLTKAYGQKEVVDHVHFSVEQGELLALLGVNGAGKTTLIKMLCCLTPPTCGDAQLLGHSILTDTQAVKGCIAVSPQETAVAPNLTVWENLELMAGAHGIDNKLADERINHILEIFSLEEHQKKRAKTLSGGYCRRLSIAMALISQPEILFLDEPTLGLDILARRQLWSIIAGLKNQVTVVLTTHYLEEAEALADRICILKCGKVCALGTAEELETLAHTQTFEDAFVALAERKE